MSDEKSAIKEHLKRHFIIINFWWRSGLIKYQSLKILCFRHNYLLCLNRYDNYEALFKKKSLNNEFNLRRNWNILLNITNETLNCGNHGTYNVSELCRIHIDGQGIHKDNFDCTLTTNKTEQIS